MVLGALHHRAARWAGASLAAAMALGGAGARAQLIDRYFQSDVPGFDLQHGLADLPRVEPGGAGPVVHVAGLTVLADLQETAGVDSNVDGMPGGPGSSFLETAPDVSVAAAGPRGRFGLDFTLDDLRYFTLPRQDRTNWTASAGLTYALGRDTLVLGYAHLAEHELTTDIASPASTRAIPFESDDFRASYATRFGRLLLTPNAEVTTFRFGGATVGAAADLNDRTVGTAGIAALYPVAATRDVVLAVQDILTDYSRRQPGTVSLNSDSVLALAGVQDRGESNWGYRLLVGVEHRSFSAKSIQSVTTPVTEASLTWRPQHRTSLTVTVTREVEDSAASGVGSYTYTASTLTAEQTLRHDLVLQGRAGLQVAEYRAGGSQISYGAGASLVWTLSPRLRLSLDYDHRDQGGVSGVAGGAVSAAFTQDRAALSLRITP